MKRSSRPGWLAWVTVGSMALTGCSTMGLWSAGSASSPLQAIEHRVKAGTDTSPHVFEFVQGAELSEGSESLGSGLITVSVEGRQLQAIGHVFELPMSALDRKNWIEFHDLDGDGWQDFMVPSSVAASSGVKVMAVYRFDPKKQEFVFADALSNLGEITPAGHACVSVRLPDRPAAFQLGRFCHSPQGERWVQQVSVSTPDRPTDAGAPCSTATPDLTLCRQHRMSLDRRLMSDLRAMSKDRHEALLESNGRHYANQYLRMRLTSHNAWLRYRDARCMAHAREQALPARLVASAAEACKHDLAQQQWLQYQARQVSVRRAEERSE